MEEWKDICGYERYYQVSNYGRVRNKLTSKILIQTKTKAGYYHLTLGYSKRKDMLVHRLVAMAFVENKQSLPIVNHIDENKLNNHADNLEWCTQEFNVNYKNAGNHKKHSVIQMDMSNNHIKTWRSLQEAEKETNVKYQNISRCCRKLRKSAGGYIWRYCNN